MTSYSEIQSTPDRAEPTALVHLDTTERPVTTSLIVAERFDKQHKDVLKAIRNLECSEEFTGRNFAPSEYTDSTGRKLPMVEITRDGFMFLAMGFTGKAAATWKERFIAAFNELERRHREANDHLPELLDTQRQLISTQQQLIGLQATRIEEQQRPRRRALGEEERAEILRLADEGLSYAEIARRLDRPAATVRGYLRRNRTGRLQ